MQSPSGMPESVIKYRINDSTRPMEARCRDVVVDATPEELAQLVDLGYLVLPGLIGTPLLARLRAGVDEVYLAERDHPNTEYTELTGYYFRHILDKNPAFLDLFELPRTVSIARAALGPQVWFGAEARVAIAGVEGQRIPWHIHHRVIPNPLPPLFAFPHAIHGLIYLDELDPERGPLCVLPGSHRDHHLDLPAGHTIDLPGQVLLSLRAGDVVLHHANLWHRTLPSSKLCESRRVILIGYTPSWIRGDISVGVVPTSRPTEVLRRSERPEIRELAGEFHWQPGG